MDGYGYTNYGIGPRDNDWNKPSYYARPVIADAEGRGRPIGGYIPSNQESYLTGGRVVEYGYAPAVVITDYKFSPPTKVETVKDYGVANSRLGRPSSPVRDRPQRVEEFTTQVQTEVSRPARTGFFSTPTNRRNPPTSIGYNQGYAEYDWNKPRDDKSPEYYQRSDLPMKESAVITKEYGWERQGPKGWTGQPSYDSAQLSKPTTDIGEAVNYLKAAAQTLSVNGGSAAAVVPQTRFGLPVSTVPKPVVDSNIDAAKRYGNFNLGTRPFRTGETYRNY